MPAWSAHVARVATDFAFDGSTRMHVRALLPLLLLAACNVSSPVENGSTASGSTPQLPGAASPASATEPYSDKLQWMLERTAFAEDPDVPCLKRDFERPAWVEDPTTRTRLREVRSDSYWLGRWARENLGERLAYARVGYDWTPGPDRIFPESPPPLIYEIAVTGSDPVKVPPLGGRAMGVPVKVIYDVPYSFDEFMERRRIGHEATRDLLDTNGEGGSPESGWAVMIDVFSETGKPDPQALAQCDRLRRAYDLPVLMEFSSARVTMDMGELPEPD